MPTPPHPENLYHAVLSSLAKAILLQAETEVTATKKSAVPLSLVTASLLRRLPMFPEVLWAKLMQRAGGWCVPIVVQPEPDGEGEGKGPVRRQWASPEERRKVMGYRDGETESEYLTRVAGMMRVYFLVMWSPGIQDGGSAEEQRSMLRMYQPARFWVWFSRLLAAQGWGLLESAVGAEVIYGTFLTVFSTRLEVGGVCLALTNLSITQLRSMSGGRLLELRGVCNGTRC
jgi:nucleoporin GLE1